ncbi:hypothetical protein QQX98_006568 [Neonectria punicea]|uniref:NmrA-like domain-containing protein n=1 Tax=Neonectria punicea TaxID=979145 RepID=A0ABR1H1M5_9HYPO
MLVLIAGITGSLGQRFDDANALDQAVKGVDGIICCYSPGPVLDLDGNLRLLRAAERAGVKVFIHSSWNNDWSKINFGEFELYDPHIAFGKQAAMTSTINPYGPGSFTSDGGKAKLEYWADGNLRRMSCVQEGKGGFFRFRSGEVTIDSLADAYKRVTGNEVEVTRMGELEDLERDVARLRLEHGRAKYWAHLPQAMTLVATKGGWEMKAEDMTVLDHVKKPRSLEECLKEHLKV